jgi:hypothetical protein
VRKASGLLGVIYCVLHVTMVLSFYSDSRAEEGFYVIPVPVTALTFKGSWDASVTYNAKDVVFFSGSSWFCLAGANKGDIPTLYPNEWSMLAQKGDTGATGPQGPKGDKGDTGATGPQGAQGSQGAKGDTGMQGPAGSTGSQGAKGDAGTGSWTPVMTGGVTTTDNSTFIRTTGGTGDWDAQVYSVQGFVRGCFATASPNKTDAALFFGLSDNPAQNSRPEKLNYSFLFEKSDKLYVYEMGSTLVRDTYSPSDHFTISYDGKYIRYYKNNTLLRSVSRAIGNALYLDSSFHGAYIEPVGEGVGVGLTNVAFGPMGSAGDTGPQGPKGDKGATGATGPQGPQGPAAPSAICTWGNKTYSTGAQCRGTGGGYCSDIVPVYTCSKDGSWTTSNGGRCNFAQCGP